MKRAMGLVFGVGLYLLVGVQGAQAQRINHPPSTSRIGPGPHGTWIERAGTALGHWARRQLRVRTHVQHELGRARRFAAQSEHGAALRTLTIQDVGRAERRAIRSLRNEIQLRTRANIEDHLSNGRYADGLSAISALPRGPFRRALLSELGQTMNDPERPQPWTSFRGVIHPDVLEGEVVVTMDELLTHGILSAVAGTVKRLRPNDYHAQDIARIAEVLLDQGWHVTAAWMMEMSWTVRFNPARQKHRRQALAMAVRIHELEPEVARQLMSTVLRAP